MDSSKGNYATNNNNNDNLISPSYNLDQTTPNPSIRDPLLSPFYYSIPSPFHQYENDDSFIQHMYGLHLPQQSQITEANAPNTIGSEMGEYSDNIEELLGESNSQQNESVMIKEIPKTRTSKKDRHSKIETAQGPRDRRMRLSLHVAREFFDLQDTLGYNKASKTVEWLLSKSKAAIKDLTSSGANSPSSTSECDVVSKEKGKHVASPTKEAKNTRGLTRKQAFSPIAKESREKARARARERTREKRKGDVSRIGFETIMSHQMNPLESWGQNENTGSQIPVLDNGQEPISSMIFNHHMHNNGASQEHEFTDFNLYGRPWDASSEY